MLSPARDNSALESVYVENYLDCVENLPNDLQRHFSHMLELDVNCQRYLREIDQHQIVLAKSTSSTGARKFALAGVQNTLILLQDIGDEKLQLVQKIQELIEKKARQLDVNSRSLRPKIGQENNFPLKVANANAVAVNPRPTTATTPTNNSNGTTPTNEKPGRGRGRKTKVEAGNDSGDANVLSENQSSNLPSTSSGPPKKANTVNNEILIPLNVQIYILKDHCEELISTKQW
ncbi:hypothetical protein QAD02_010837 [Eretmocerus hayati]|uniref:Uncharacterized protein n=1 Tax=Eretmocerus hayati TaxID=131215 RepID=A0ACC2NV55_9HYME|nr:hypothetical protein QAD02_010837 [Eretmocerus hayati]